MKTKLLFIDTTETILEDIESYETTNFFLKLVFRDHHEHNIALGFVREMIWRADNESF